MDKKTDKGHNSSLEINKLIYHISRKVCYQVLPLYFASKIIGKENIPAKEPAILASKHTYWFDLVTTACHIDRTIYTFAKSAYFDRTTMLSKLRRWWFKKMGAFNVNENGDHIGLRPSDIDLILEPVKKGSLLLIYPEGTRVEGGIGKFEKGLGATVRIQAERNGQPRLPVIPMSPAYSRKPFNTTASYIPFWERIKVALVIGKPIYYNGETAREFTQRIKEKITECYLNAEALVKA